MAAAAVGRELMYFTFGNKELSSGLSRLHELLYDQGVSVGKYNVVDYCPIMDQYVTTHITDDPTMHKTQVLCMRRQYLTLLM